MLHYKVMVAKSHCVIWYRDAVVHNFLKNFIRTVASVFNYYTNYTVPLPPVPLSTLLISSSKGLSQNELEYHLIDIFAIVVSKATTFLDVTASISLADAISSCKL